jgi:hypothetical protein
MRRDEMEKRLNSLVADDLPHMLQVLLVIPILLPLRVLLQDLRDLRARLVADGFSVLLPVRLWVVPAPTSSKEGEGAKSAWMRRTRRMPDIEVKYKEGD